MYYRWQTPYLVHQLTQVTCVAILAKPESRTTSWVPRDELSEACFESWDHTQENIKIVSYALYIFRMTVYTYHCQMPMTLSLVKQGFPFLPPFIFFHISQPKIKLEEEVKSTFNWLDKRKKLSKKNANPRQTSSFTAYLYANQPVQSKNTH